MNEGSQTVGERWLNAHAPGFRDLPGADRQAIFEFSFLWSLFEAQIMDNYARADLIRQRVGSWATEGTLEADRYDAELFYFRNRYFNNGALTYHFPHLNLRAADSLETVKAVIEGTSNAPHDRILCLLMIVWRLRNNLFHGEKWAYQLRDQLENFIHANSVLMRVLEHHGRLN